MRDECTSDFSKLPISVSHRIASSSSTQFYVVVTRMAGGTLAWRNSKKKKRKKRRKKKKRGRKKITKGIKGKGNHLRHDQKVSANSQMSDSQFRHKTYQCCSRKGYQKQSPKGERVEVKRKVTGGNMQQPIIVVGNWM